MIGGRGASQMSNTFSVLCRAKRWSPLLLHGGVDISAYVVGTAEHRDGVARRREQLAAVRGELRVAGPRSSYWLITHADLPSSIATACLSSSDASVGPRPHDALVPKVQQADGVSPCDCGNMVATMIIWLRRNKPY